MAAPTPQTAKAALGPRRPPAVPDSNRRRKTRQRLMAAAYDVFVEHGLRGATIEQITEAANFTRGAFYSNFASKEELFLAVMEQKRDELLQRLRSRLQEFPLGPPESLTADDIGLLLVHALQPGIDDRGWLVAEMETLQAALRDPALAQRQVEMRRREVAQYTALVRDALQLMGRRLLVDEEQAVAILLGVADRCVTDLLLENAPLNTLAERVSKPIAAVVLGMTAPVEAAPSSQA